MTTFLEYVSCAPKCQLWVHKKIIVSMFLQPARLITICVETVSGMEVGSNPTTWLVAVAFFLLAIAIDALTNGKDNHMKTTNSFIANVRTVYKRLKTSLITTTQAIATAVVTDLVTTFLHSKGAPGNG
ncbi:hypothetical protein [Rhizobium sp. NZLR11]|uniref:hypothetical protein n=1 Tax=Rhizobium sp. NZLR11 TaxID=2731098 RepID=UPI001C82C9D2|nr:hypothetical protein [Rhizobium sp. NZLR11]MBX5210792.1 hypothetical protein [Rhizobium sp. NZLR11]